MAHADYDCCAFCDCKMNYAGCYDADTKGEVCGDCADLLDAMGLTPTPQGIIDWLDNAPIKLFTALFRGYRSCYYSNKVDESVTAYCATHGLEELTR